MPAFSSALAALTCGRRPIESISDKETIRSVAFPVFIKFNHLLVLR
jgi:hypothetical protein